MAKITSLCLLTASTRLKNSTSSSVCFWFQTLADIFFAAAKEGGLVDPHKIEQILKVSCPESSTTTEKTVMEKIITGETVVI